MRRKTNTKPRKTPTQRRSQDAVEAIVEAATRICREQGYEATNVNAIARLAGVSVGSLYQYFPSKEAVVAEVGRRLRLKMNDVFSTGLAELGRLPIQDAALPLVRRIVAAYAVDPQLRRVLAEVPSAVGAVSMPDFDALLGEAIVGYLKFHRDNIRPTNRRLAGKLIQTAVELVALQLTVDDAFHGIDRAEAEQELAQLIIGYLEKR
jgi:AcrR family transcriptional regulator